MNLKKEVMSKLIRAGQAKRADASLVCKYCGSSKILATKIYTYKESGNSARRYRCSDCGVHFKVNIGNKEHVRVLIISDTHCGHVTGLTPPEYQQVKKEFSQFQKDGWLWYYNMLNRLKPIDVLICNGDLIDGRQERSGGSELITGNRVEQCDMAIECIRNVGAKKTYIVRGTPYHTGKLEDWEDIIAKNTNACDIGNRLKININGCIIDTRHKVGRSTIPHGRFTQMAKAAMWDDLQTIGKSDYRSNIIIRSHVHYHVFGGHSNNRIFMTTPALQGRTNYGDKECEGSIDYGFVKIDIDNNGLVDNWKCYTASLDTNNIPIIDVSF